MVPPQDMPDVGHSWTRTGQRGDFFQSKPWTCAHTANAIMFKWRCWAVNCDQGVGTRSLLPRLLWKPYNRQLQKRCRWCEILQGLSIKANRSGWEQHLQRSFSLHFFPRQFFSKLFRNMLGMTVNGETAFKLVFLALQL